MERKEFRAYFDSDRARSFAEFDRRGFATIGCPLPNLKDAEEWTRYSKVKELHIGIHGTPISSDALGVLLDGWGSTLERLSIQDHRRDGLRDPKDFKLTNVLGDCRKSLSKLSCVWSMDVINVSLGKPAVIEMSKMPKLKSLRVSRCRFTYPAFKALENSDSLDDILVSGCSGVYSEDAKSLSQDFRERCRVVVYKY